MDYELSLLVKKLYLTTKIDKIQIIQSGSKFSDNQLLSHLSDGVLSFEDLILKYLT